MGSVIVAALSGTTLILEVVVIAIVVILIVAVIVLNSRKNKPAKADAAPSPTSYYQDLQQPAQTPTGAPSTFAPTAAAGQPDPFAGFGAGPPAAPPPPPQAPPPPPAPAPGTPAGWLPDPSGTPNTLRYWDGASWTQHVAQRS